MQFRIVPDITRNRDPIARGRKPKSQLSQQLLKKKTVFVPSDIKRTWGNIYRLARNHGLRARVRQTNINGEEGYVMWFEDLDDLELEAHYTKNKPYVYAWFAPDGQVDYVGRGSLQRARTTIGPNRDWWTPKHTLKLMQCDSEWHAMEMEGAWGIRYQPRFNKEGYRYENRRDKDTNKTDTK